MTSASTMKAQRVDSARVLQLFLSRLVSCSTCRGDGAGRNAMCAGAEELPVFLESTGTVCRTATFSLPSLELKPRKKKFVHTTCIGSASTSMASEASAFCWVAFRVSIRFYGFSVRFWVGVFLVLERGLERNWLKRRTPHCSQEKSNTAAGFAMIVKQRSGASQISR